MSCSFLANLAEIFVPGFLRLFNWINLNNRNIWNMPISTGTAFEWTIFAAIISEAKLQGWQSSFPILNYPRGDSLFLLRNEIPRQHGAQPGHSHQSEHKIKLQDRFYQALVPEVQLERNGNFLSIFREGCPYHSIMSEMNYDECPDIVMVPGYLMPGYPQFLQNDRIINYNFNFSHCANIKGSIRVLDSPILPLISKCPPTKLKLPVSCVVECSINKTAEHSNRQLIQYYDIYNNPYEKLYLAIIAGNSLDNLTWPHFAIDLKSRNINLIEQQIRSAVKTIIEKCGLC